MFWRYLKILWMFANSITNLGWLKHVETCWNMLKPYKSWEKRYTVYPTAADFVDAHPYSLPLFNNGIHRLDDLSSAITIQADARSWHGRKHGTMGVREVQIPSSIENWVITWYKHGINYRIYRKTLQMIVVMFPSSEISLMRQKIHTEGFLVEFSWDFVGPNGHHHVVEPPSSLLAPLATKRPSMNRTLFTLKDVSMRFFGILWVWVFWVFWARDVLQKYWFFSWHFWFSWSLLFGGTRRSSVAILNAEVHN